MNQDILSLLQSRTASFSKGQRMIAGYITGAYDKAAFMTARTLGKAVGVSESTVVRFAVELGYDGYPDMQKAMQDMVRNRLTANQRMEVARDRIGDQDVISTVIQSDIEKLRHTCETVNREAFAKAVDAILAADQIYVLGVRSAAPLAGFLGYYLNYMFRSVHVVTSSGSTMFEKIVGVSSRDAVIALSFPRYSASTAKGAQFCRSTGATVIGITDTELSPLGRNSNYVLAAKSDMVSLVDSLVAGLSLINALVVALAARRSRELINTFDRLEQIWDQYQVYEKQEDAHG